MTYSDQQRLLSAIRAVLQADAEPIRDKPAQDEMAFRLLVLSMRIGELREIVNEIEAQR